MLLLELLIIMVVGGVVLWLNNNYNPMHLKVRKILNIFIVVIAILFFLNAFGVFGTASRIAIIKI